MKLSVLAGILLIGSVPGCSGRTEADAMDSKRVVDSSGGSVALGLDSARTYRPMAVSAAGSVGGTVSLQAASADSSVPVGRDPQACGDSAMVTEARANGSSLAGVLVWVDGISAGKPNSGARRETVTIEHCRFAPRLLAVNAGATINFFSRDPLTQTARFYREGSDEPLDEVRTMDAGQVVPSEKIARLPGMVQARGVEQGGSRGYIAVFDHPYFAITDESGAFTIDSLPPGTYTVKLWHERLAAPVEQRVVVTSGGRGRLDVTLTLN
jgi:hypothetical protein